MSCLSICPFSPFYSSHCSSASQLRLQRGQAPVHHGPFSWRGDQCCNKVCLCAHESISATGLLKCSPLPEPITRPSTNFSSNFYLERCLPTLPPLTFTPTGSLIFFLSIPRSNPQSDLSFSSSLKTCFHFVCICPAWSARHDSGMISRCFILQTVFL